MKRPPILLVATLAVLALTLSDLADAGRMGGGRSFGAQRQSVTPSKSAPPATAPAGSATAQPTTPASPAATPPAAPAPAPSGASRWLGPIAGIAAGLGLAALLSHFGLSEGLGSVLLIGVLVAAVFFGFRMLLSRRGAARPPFRLAGAETGGNVRPGYETLPAPMLIDASTMEPAAAPAALAAAPGLGVTRKPLPEGFDAAGFATEAKRQFVRMQGSYDDDDRSALSALMTSEMYSEIGRELDERGPHHATQIVTLDADVLDASTEGDKHWASVRFTGLLREDGESSAKSIDEVWNLTKPVRGTSGWLLAGITQVA